MKYTAITVTGGNKQPKQTSMNKQANRATDFIKNIDWRPSSSPTGALIGGAALAGLGGTLHMLSTDDSKKKRILNAMMLIGAGGIAGAHIGAGIQDAGSKLIGKTASMNFNTIYNSMKKQALDAAAIDKRTQMQQRLLGAWREDRRQKMPGDVSVLQRMAVPANKDNKWLNQTLPSNTAAFYANPITGDKNDKRLRQVLPPNSAVGKAIDKRTQMQQRLLGAWREDRRQKTADPVRNIDVIKATPDKSSKWLFNRGQ